MSGVRTVILVAMVLAVSGCVSASSKANVDKEKKKDGSTDPICLGTLKGLEIRTASIAEIQAALAEGRFTSVDLVNWYIERIDAYDNRGEVGVTMLNGVRTTNPRALEIAAELDAERAAGHVRGPMHGIPVMLKDNTGAEGMPTTAGALALQYNMAPDAFATAKLRAAGAVIMGKYELLEWANWGANPNGSSMGGPQRNGYNFGSASASSSGPGVGGSMAYSSIAVGSETSGSILGPTQTNSLAGLKTSHGLISGSGVIPIAHFFDVLGPMGRNVYDLAVTLSAMAGTDPKDPHSAHADSFLPPNGDYTQFLKSDALKGVRLGYDPMQTGELFTKAKETLTELGAVLVPMQTGTAYGGLGLATEYPVLPNEFHAEINEYLQKEADPSLPFKTWHQLILYNIQNHPDTHNGVGASQFALASAATPGRMELVAAQGPPAVLASRQIADRIFIDNQIAAVVSQGSPNTGLGAAAGYPTVMIPLGYTTNADGFPVPVGISWFGRQFTDGNLLGYAYAYEQATHARIPPEVANPKLTEGLCTSTTSSDAAMSSEWISHTDEVDETNPLGNKPLGLPLI
jgi:amidase